MAGLTGAAQLPAASAIVTIEFRVTGDDGRLVHDLTAADIRLRIDNRERAVRSLQLHRPQSSRWPPPFASNAAGHRGRDLIVVVDEESILPASEGPVRQAVAHAISSVAPADRVAIVSLHPSGINAVVTGPQAQERSVTDGIRGRAPRRESSIDFACRTRRGIQRLIALLDGVQSGAATTMLLFSSTLAAPDPVRLPVPGADGGCILQASDFDDVGNALTRAALRFEVVRVVDSTIPEEPAERLAGLERLAGMAATRVTQLAADSSPQMERILRESAGFYALTVAVDPTEVTGAKRRIQVETRRPRVRVSAPPEVTFPRPVVAPRSPREMLRVAGVFRELSLVAIALPAKMPASNDMKVLVLIEPADADVALDGAVAGLFNARGQLVAEWAAEPADLSRRPIVAAMAAPPGQYRLRVAAVDKSGRAGALDDDVRAQPVVAGTLSASALLLGLPTAGSIDPRIVFRGGDSSVIAYLEVQGAARCETVEPVLQLSTILQPKVLQSSPLSTTEIENNGGCIVGGVFDIASLAPGDYGVRVALHVNGKQAGEVLRTLRKTVK